MKSKTVLVTGGSGFLGARCVAQALQQGYQVRTTVRSLKKEEEVRSTVTAAGADAGDALSFVSADLFSDAGWAQAAAGCEYVLHVASPFPPVQPENEDDLIVPAREGTLRVLRAARDAGVRRAVVTSSFGAIGYGHPDVDRSFAEEDWTDTESGVSAYIKSKTLAERAAWTFIKDEGRGMELSVVNPVGIFGPVLMSNYSSSVSLISMLMNGDMPGVPRLYFPIVDVRDAAELHLRAMTAPEAAGQRFIASAGDSVSLQHIALTLRERLGDAAQRVPTEILADDVIRQAAQTNPAMRETADNLGIVRHVNGDKARRVLGWTPRSSEDAVAATAESLVRLGLLRGSAEE